MGADLSDILSPDTGRHDRAVSVAEWLLTALSTRGETGVYISRLGHLTVAFEAYHVAQCGEPYIDIEPPAASDSNGSDVVRAALVDILEAYPTRRAYLHGRATQKVSTRQADTIPDDEQIQAIVGQLLDAYGDLSPTALRREVTRVDW